MDRRLQDILAREFTRFRYRTAVGGLKAAAERVIDIVKSPAPGGDSAEGVDETSATRIGLGGAPDPPVGDATALTVPGFAAIDAADEAADQISVIS